MMMRLMIAAVALVALTSCGDERLPGDSPAPAASIADVETVEELTEAAANRLIEFSDALRKRDYGAAREYLTATFRGRWPEGGARRTVEMPLGVTRVEHAIADDVGLEDASGFLEQMQGLLAPFESLEHVFFKTRGAEFSRGGKEGRVELTASIIGTVAGGGRRALYGWARGEVEFVDGTWRLHRFRLERFRDTVRSKAMFTDVASSAGMAFRGPRLGTGGNDKFHWRGAACGDIDGDGLFDVFTAGHDRNFLYRNRGDGHFEEIAARAGLASPVGATSPLFFDYDDDGDCDLLAAFVGWDDDGVPGGESLRLFENDGQGRFIDVSARTGVSAFRTAAFSTVAADFDGDGRMDVFVCAYNRLEAVYPDSWHAATNGSANLLLRNIDGKRFENVAGKSGVAGRSWSYAAAVADFDEDGDQDIYVANDYGPNALHRNRGDGTFEDTAEELGVLDVGNGMGAAWGDLDGDGDLDLYVSNMSSSAGNRILSRIARSDGSDVEATLFKLAAGNTIFIQDAGAFKRLPADAGGISASWAWGVSLFDIDLDGLLDVYVANGFISGDSLKDT